MVVKELHSGEGAHNHVVQGVNLLPRWVGGVQQPRDQRHRNEGVRP
jgi:hypothetical protein